MPAPLPPAARPTSRRQVLTAALVGSVTLGLTGTGCALRIGQPDGEPTTPGRTVDETARARVAAQADRLAGSAERLLAASTVTTTRTLLARVAADHRAHATALRGRIDPPAVRPSAPGAPAGTASPSPTAASTPTLDGQAVEERAGVSDIESQLATVSADLARLLASIAAARSGHADQLRGPARATLSAGRQPPPNGPR